MRSGNEDAQVTEYLRLSVASIVSPLYYTAAQVDRLVGASIEIEAEPLQLGSQAVNSVGAAKDRTEDIHWEVADGCHVGGLVLAGARSVEY